MDLFPFFLCKTFYCGKYFTSVLLINSWKIQFRAGRRMKYASLFVSLQLISKKFLLKCCGFPFFSLLGQQWRKLTHQAHYPAHITDYPLRMHHPLWNSVAFTQVKLNSDEPSILVTFISLVIPVKAIKITILFDPSSQKCSVTFVMSYVILHLFCFGTN